MKKKSIVFLVLAVVMLFTMAFPAMAKSEKTKSVTYKDTPIITPNADGEIEIVDKATSDSVVNTVSPNQVTLGGAASLKGDDRTAYDELAKAAKLTDVVEKLAEVLKKNFPDADADKLAVRTVYNIMLADEAQKKLDREADDCIKLTLRYNVKSGAPFVVIAYQNGKWVALDANHYTVENGKVTVKLEQVGLIAFLVG